MACQFAGNPGFAGSGLAGLERGITRIQHQGAVGPGDSFPGGSGGIFDFVEQAQGLCEKHGALEILLPALRRFVEELGGTGDVAGGETTPREVVIRFKEIRITEDGSAFKRGHPGAVRTGLNRG